LSKTKADQKTEPEKVEVRRCPLSGISCAECGYEAIVSGYPDCFLQDLVRAIQEVGDSR